MTYLTATFLIFLVVVVLVLSLVDKQTRTFYLKLYGFYALICVASVVTVPFFLISPGDPQVMRFFFPIGFFISDYFLGLKFSLLGTEHLSKYDTCVMVANHQFEVDVICMAKLQPYYGRGIALFKKELVYRSGFLGFLFCLNGFLAIERSNTESDIKTLRNLPTRLVQRKEKLIAFPEGGFYNTGTINKFKTGTFHVAVKGEFPIVPIVISRYYFADKSKCRFDDGEIIISVLPPVPTAGLGSQDVKDLSKRVRDLMQAEYERINAIISARRMAAAAAAS